MYDAEHITEVRLTGRHVAINAIPPQKRGTHGRRKIGVLRQIIDAAIAAPVGQAVEFVHNCPSPQVLHGNIRMAAKHHELQGKPKVSVRGTKAYIWIEV